MTDAAPKRGRERPGRVRLAEMLGREQIVAVALFVSLCPIYLLSPVLSYGDGRLAGPTAASIVTDFDLELDEFSDLDYYGDYQTTFIDGRAYDVFPWTRSVFAVPFAAVLALAEPLGIGGGPGAVARSDTWEPVLLLIPGALTAAGAAALSGLLAWRQTKNARHRRRVAILMGAGTGLCTGYWSTSSRGMWQHGPATLMLTVALVGAWTIANSERTSRGALTLGIGATSAALIRPTMALPAMALAVWLLATRPRALPRMAAGAIAVGLPVIAVNVATFGTLMMPYFATDRVTASRPDSALYGLVGNLVSPSRGAVFFFPVLLVLAAWGLLISARSGQQIALRAALFFSFGAIYVAVSTTSAGWWAGHSYGPRYLVDVVPILAFLSVPPLERIVSGTAGRARTAFVAALAGWSLFVNAQGAIVRDTTCWNVVPTDIDDDRSRVWDLDDTQTLWGVRWVLSNGPDVLADSCSGSDEPSTRSAKALVESQAVPTFVP